MRKQGALAPNYLHHVIPGDEGDPGPIVKMQVQQTVANKIRAIQEIKCKPPVIPTKVVVHKHQTIYTMSSRATKETRDPL